MPDGGVEAPKAGGLIDHLDRCDFTRSESHIPGLDPNPPQPRFGPANRGLAGSWLAAAPGHSRVSQQGVPFQTDAEVVHDSKDRLTWDWHGLTHHGSRHVFN